jgi:hypothetical protein
MLQFEVFRGQRALIPPTSLLAPIYIYYIVNISNRKHIIPDSNRRRRRITNRVLIILVLSTLDIYGRKRGAKY